MPDCEVPAMLDCEDGEKEVNSNCKHCEASGESQQSQSYWNISLDLDLLQTIVNFYPEWFKDCNMNAVAEGNRESADNSMCIPLASSDLKGAIKLQNGHSLQRILDKNKESLKSPPAFHQQRQKLVKAKIGSILKHKLPKRLERQDLIQQALEDSATDSNFQERQKKRSDSLNGGLLHNSSTLELVKENIFADELLAKAVREFKSPCNSPKMRVEDDSGSDIFSPSPPYEFNEHSQGSLPSLEASDPNQGSPCSGITSFSMSPPSSVSSPMSVLPSVVSPSHEHIADYIVHMQPQGCLNNKDSPNKNRKKTKPKTQPKARTIKFHEYRGPPNSKNASSNSLSESPPELNFQQRQLFLELQSAFHQHNINNNNHRPQITSTVQKNSGDQTGQSNQKQTSSSPPSQQSEQQTSSQKLISNFEDLKVSDLRAELKKRNLPVSGSKPQLIERLKSHNPNPNSTPSSQSSDMAAISLLLDSIPTTGSSMSAEADAIKEFLGSLPTSESPPNLMSLEGDPCDSALEFGDMSNSPFTPSLSNEDIVQLQQICIERLQRDLERSQKQLQECQQPIVIPAPVVNTKPPTPTPPPPPPPTTTKPTPPTSNNNYRNGETNNVNAESKAAQKQLIQQFLQQKIQRQEELQKTQRQQAIVNSSRNSTSTTNPNSTLTALLKSSPLNANLVDLDLTKTYFPASTPIKREKEDFSNPFPGIVSMNGTSEDDFPGVIPILVCETSTDPLTSSTTVISPPNALSNRSSSLPSFSALCKPPPTRSNTDPQFQIARPPPDYDAATRHLNKVKQHPIRSSDGEDGNPRQAKKHKTSVKSQAVDDVLAVLIASGDLPPSAAEEPAAPPISSSQRSVSLFHTSSSNDVFFSKAMTTSSLLSTAVISQMDGPHSPDINLAQSVMDMTPPSSAGFGETGCVTAASLDFGPLLDLDDMDLGLDDDNQVSSNLDPTLSISISQELKTSLDYGINKPNTLLNSTMKTNAVSDRGVDNDIIEWLPMHSDTSLSSTTSNHFHNSSSSYALTSEQDALFPNAQDSLDFLGDDMDFNPPNDLFFPWGEKPDFT